MTNFSGIDRQGIWSWLTPERAVLVVPVLAGFGLSMALLSVGITPLTIRVREQSEVVEQLKTKAEFVPVLHQQLPAGIVVDAHESDVPVLQQPPAGTVVDAPCWTVPVQPPAGPFAAPATC